MKIVALADLHGYLPEVPECDVVCIAGDILPLQYQRNIIMSVSWLTQIFKKWADGLPCKKVVFIAGNHDFVFETLGPKADRGPAEVMNDIFLPGKLVDSKLVYLRDCEVEIDGVKFYGTPWCPSLQNWAFYANHDDLIYHFNRIPHDIDVLLTHCPPQIDKLGVVLQEDVHNTGYDYGSQELKYIVERRPNIKWLLCGHIHTGIHEPITFNKTKMVNVAVKDEHYKVNYKPFVFEL